MISQDEAGPRRAARGSPSSSTARRSSPAAPARARARSAAGSSRTTGSRRSSRCPTSSSTTPASRPTSGSSPTARAPERRGKVQLVDARELLGEDAQEPRREAQGDLRRADRRDHPPLRRRSRRTSGSRSSRTRRSASSGSPSSARCGCATTVARATLRAARGVEGVREARPRTQREALVGRLDGARRPRDDRSRRGARRDSAAARRRPSRRRCSEALAVRDPDAPVVTDARRPEPDPELRDQRERPAARSRSSVRGGPDRAPRERAVPRGRRRLHGGRGPARTSPTPGSTTRRRRSATRSRSPGTSTATCRRARSRRSTPRSRRSRRRSRSCWRGDGVSGWLDALVRSLRRARRHVDADQRPSRIEPRWLRRLGRRRRRRMPRSSSRTTIDASATDRPSATCSLRPGDLVVNGSGVLRRASARRRELDGIVSPDVLRVLEPSRASIRASSRYLAAVDAFIGESVASIDGVEPSDVTCDVGDCSSIARSAASDEQREIADFLDAETARIDALIEKKRRMIDAARRAASRRSRSSARSSAGVAAREARRSSRGSGVGHTPSRRASRLVGRSRRSRGSRPVTSRRCAATGSSSSTTTRARRSASSGWRTRLPSCTAGTVVLVADGVGRVLGDHGRGRWRRARTSRPGPAAAPRPRFLLLVPSGDALRRCSGGSRWARRTRRSTCRDIESIRVPLPPSSEQDAVVSRRLASAAADRRSVDAIERQIDLLASTARR